MHGPLGAEPQTVIRGGLAIIVAVAALVLDLSRPGAITGTLAVLAMAGLLVGLVFGLFRTRTMRIRRRIGALLGADTIILASMCALVVARGFILTQQFAQPTEGYDRAARTYVLLFLVIGTLQGFSEAMPARLGRVALKLAQRPALMLAGSFAAMILVGTMLLTLPISVENVAYISFVNSLFTITSAVCVTGMAIGETATTYTFFGEIVILLALQLGGIGIMTVAALAMSFTRDTALVTQLRYAAMLDARRLGDLRSTVQSIVVGTLAFEAVGATLLYLQFAAHPQVDGQSVAWMAVFHAVSAFCSAGFSLFPGGISLFVDDFGVQSTMMTLAFCGGLGFPVMRELVLLSRARAIRLVRPSAPAVPQMSLVCRVVLGTSAVLIVAGAAMTLLFEHRGAFASLGWGEKLLAALFHSVNTRSAGFNTVDTATFTAPTLLWTCVLMFIGGSPGSTAGGIKTTTAATIFATLRGELRGHEPCLGRRAIEPEIFRRAIAVATLSALMVLLSLTLLTLTESHDFDRLFVAAVAAFSTAGIETGITPTLSIYGKLIVIVTMFVGRCGPLTIALAVASSGNTRPPYRLARESLPIG